MKTRFLILLQLLISQYSFSQKNAVPEINLNHIYFVVDDSTYKALDQNSFLKDTLFIFQKATTKMDGKTWSGKYLNLERNYLEIFPPKGYENAEIGETGLGYYLHQPVLLQDMCNNWQRLTKDKVVCHPMTMNKGKDTAWNEVMNYKDTLPDSKHAALFVLSYPGSYYKFMGFSPEQITNGIPYDSIFFKMRNGHAFKRIANCITSIHLTLNPEEYKRIVTGLKSFGYKGSGRTFKKDITIIIDQQAHPAIRLNQIVIKLNESVPFKRVIDISPAFQVIAEKDIVTLNMK